jgi:hypothetical protein
MVVSIKIIAIVILQFMLYVQGINAVFSGHWVLLLTNISHMLETGWISNILRTT